jgi:F-type H+-transporting ATPase subunit gamma
MKRREIQARLELYDDLAGILGVMRSFALAELNRVTKRERVQSQVVQSLMNAYRDIGPHSNPEPNAANDIWILFGATRGFCGSFNEDVLQAWQVEGRAAVLPPIVVGERLVSHLPESVHAVAVPGATGAVEALVTVERILVAVADSGRSGLAPTGLVACVRDDDGTRIQRVLPLPVEAGSGRGDMPMMNEPAAIVAAGVSRYCIYHTLLALLLRSIRVENRLRLMQMDSALSHLDKNTEKLQLQRNRLRQEEIIGEIEAVTREKADVY